LSSVKFRIPNLTVSLTILILKLIKFERIVNIVNSR